MSNEISQTYSAPQQSSSIANYIKRVSLVGVAGSAISGAIDVVTHKIAMGKTNLSELPKDEYVAKCYQAKKLPWKAIGKNALFTGTACALISLLIDGVIHLFHKKQN